MKAYDRGDMVRLTVGFTSAGGGLADPGTITCKIKQPNGAVTTYVYEEEAELVKESVGSYYLDIQVDAPGTWHYRWAGNGTVTAAAESAFRVLESEIL